MGEDKTAVRITLATLSFQLRTHGETLKEIKDLFDGHVKEDREVQSALRYSIDGHDEEPGIRGRIQTLEGFASQTKWTFALFIGALVSGGVGYFFFKG